jgi:hypothetical protein
VSNARITGRLNALADEVESGQTSVGMFADELIGHTGAVDNVPYALIVEARQVWAQLTRAIDQGQEQLVAVRPLADWIRGWTARVPRELVETVDSSDGDGI